MKSLQEGLHANDEMNRAIEEIKLSGLAMAESIQKLIEASESIASISRELNDIGLRTKILAINAGVEAAHAGEHGATFQVVAAEIRAVAEQCKQASERSGSVITNSISISQSAIQVGHRIQSDIREIILHQQDVADALSTAATHQVELSFASVSAVEKSDLQFDTATMATDVPEVDRQHRQLFDMVNQLEAAARQGKAREEIDRMLNFLGDYVQQHFSTEERLMAERHCPSLEKNKQAHAALIKTYTEWRQQYEEKGAKLSLVMELKNILSQWLVSHICGIDRCLKNTSTKIPPTRKLSPALS